MSLRTYLIATVIVFVCTAAISVWKRKRGTKAVLKVFFQVAGIFTAIVCFVFLLAKLLAYLGIAQSGFFI